MSKKEREMCDYEMDFKKSFFDDDKISWRPGLKTGMKSANFWSELGSGFGELGSTPPPGLPRNTPQDFEEVIHNRTAISANLLYLSYVVFG